MIHSQKSFVGITLLIIAFAALVGIGVWQYKEYNKPAVNSDWKTYTNADMGISFNYPPNLTLEESHLNNEIETDFVANGDINIIVDSTIYYKQELGSPKTINEIVGSSSNSSSIKIDGKQGIRLDSVQDGSAAYFPLDTKGNILLIEAGPSLLNQVLATLKFTK